MRRVLSSDTSTVVQKRATMRLAFGDYHAQMAKDPTPRHPQGGPLLPCMRSPHFFFFYGAAAAACVVNLRRGAGDKSERRGSVARWSQEREVERWPLFARPCAAPPAS